MATPRSRRRTSAVVNDTNPRTAAMIAALDVGNGLRLAGRAGGAFRIGLTGSRQRSFRGDLGPLQQFRGYAGPLSGTANRRTGAFLALPFTGAPTPKGSK